MFELTPDMLAAVEQPTATANGLPNAVYTDPQALELERQEIFSKNWTAIGFASDVPDQGCAKPVSFLGVPLMMVRGRNSELHVFHNVCRHRGHPLVSESCVLKGSITCPYHAWTYTYDGELRGTPNIGGTGINSVEGFDRSKYGLLPVRSHVWMDVVFIDLSGALAPFEEHAASLIRRWEQYLGKGGETDFIYPPSHGDIEFDLATNWKFPVENYVESYHLPTIHPELNSYSRIEDHYHIMEDDIGAGQGTMVYDFAGQANIELPSHATWPLDRKHEAEYVALYPNVLFGIQADHTYAVIIEPVAVDRSRERMRLYFLPEACGESHAQVRETVADGWKLVFAQDVGAVEGMQSGRHSPDFDGGVFSPVLDTPTHHFHRWVARQLAA